MSTATKPETGSAAPAENAPRASARTEPARPAGGRRRFVLPIVAILVLAGLGWVFQKWSYGRVHESTDNAQVDGHLVPVLAKVGGYVAAVNAGENDRVTAGSTLVRIDDAEYRVRLAEAQADLAAARASAGTSGTTGQAEAAVRTATGQQSVYSAQIAAAQANLTRADADLARMRELAAKEIVSRQQLDAAQAAADAARANLTAVQRQASAAGASVESAQAGVRLAEARLQSAQASLQNATLQLSYTTVTAPVGGLVARKQVEVGQLIQPGQPMLSIVADTGIWVTANFKETQLADLKVGQPVELDVDAYPGCTASGTVESLSAATGARFALLPPDNATGNFTKVVQRVPVRIRIVEGCGADRPLRPGMSVEAHVATK